MYRMYPLPGLYFQNLLGTDVIPRQNVLEYEEDLFIHQYTNILLYKKQKWLGMLCPYAKLFYPLTAIRTEEKVIATEEREEIKDNKLKELKIETAERNKKDSHDIETEAKQEWKKYKSRKLTPGTKDTNDIENEIENN